VLPIVGQVYLSQNIAIGGTSILILVSVSLETMRQVESRALMVTYDQYEAPEYFHGEDGEESKKRRFLRNTPKLFKKKTD
jgi:hypothetical protein